MGRRLRRLGVAAAAAAIFGSPATALPWSEAAVSTAGAATPIAPLTPGRAKALSVDVSRRVIIELKDRLGSIPDTPSRAAARSSAVAALQRPILAELRETRAARVHSYRLVDMIAATVSPGEEARLREDPAVASVVPDEEIHMADAAPSSAPENVAEAKPVVPPGNACRADGRTQLDPEADSLVHALSQDPRAKTAASLGYTGAGVTVGFIADGLDIHNPNFVRPDGQDVFVDYEDFSGSGTSAPTGGGEAFLDAGSIAAQGTVTYNVAHYSVLGDAEPCNIRIEGVAPGASLVGLDVFGGEDYVYSSVILQAIDYAVTDDHVDVLNESFASNPFPDVSSLDLVKEANDAAVAAGVVVSVASGDSGVTNTIGSPASDPAVISVGATTSYRLDVQDGYGGARFPGVTGWLDDNISPFSSGGTDETGGTVDVVAPGDLNWLPCSTDVAMYSDCFSLTSQPTAVQANGGTSESAPIDAGVAALVIQAYREAHHGTTPTPAVVKQIITSTATPIDAPSDQQGAGLVNAYEAVLAARSYGSTTDAVGGTLLTATPQLDVTGQPGTAESLEEQVTNNSSTPEAISASARVLGAYHPIDVTSVRLGRSHSPHMVDWSGVPNNYEPLTFSVPAGEDRLAASITYRTTDASGLDARVRLTLVAPDGKLAAYSIPQGDGGYGHVEVSHPLAGVWTAYIYSRVSSEGGTTGVVRFGAYVATWRSFGTVTPPRSRLAPGASELITIEAQTPKSPGDEAASLLLVSRSRANPTVRSVVPVISRSLIPAGTTSFSGTLTGGNGRSPYTGQGQYYEIDLASGTPELNVSITLAHNPRNPFTAWLVSPSGEGEALGSNETLQDSASGPSDVPSLGAELHVLDPAAGVWDLLIDFYGSVSGSERSQRFTVSVDEAALSASATGVPDSRATTLVAGTTYQAAVSITNSGTAPQAYFVDPRLSTESEIALVAHGGDVTYGPGSPGVDYVVPTDTTALSWTATSETASEPLVSELFYGFGDPDVYATTSGRVSAGSLAASPVAQGEWTVAPEPIGPDGPYGAGLFECRTTLTATTAAFDPAVTSATGDLWSASTSAGAAFDPVLVDPGETAQIPITITPQAEDAGTTVTGTLYIDDASLVAEGIDFVPQADQDQAITYEYSVAPG